MVHSAAYRADENPELLAAAAAGIPVVTYPQALGLLSGACDASGVSGVHGKSTTTALCGAILKEWGFPATVLVGTEVPGFGGRSTLVQGERYLVAETCEYRRHFLNFHAERILVTSVEPDHLDYFKDLDDILEAFESYGRSLPFQGTVIFCADDAGAAKPPGASAVRRDDLQPGTLRQERLGSIPHRGHHPWPRPHPLQPRGIPADVRAARAGRTHGAERDGSAGVVH